MSIITLNGCESGTGIEFEKTSTSGAGSAVDTAETTTVRSGAYALKTHAVTGGHAYAEQRRYDATNGHIVDIDEASACVRAYVYAPTSFPLSDTILRIEDMGGSRKADLQLTLSIGVGVVLDVIDATGSAIASPTTQAAISNTAAMWHKLSIAIGTGLSPGANSVIKIWWDNTLAYEASGDFNDTSNSGETQSVKFGRPVSDTGEQTLYWDDIAIGTGTAELPDGGIYPASPEADGYHYASPQWGSNNSPAGDTNLYKRIDEVPFSSTDYIGTRGGADNYSADFPSASTIGITEAINAVQIVNAMAYGSSSGKHTVNFGMADGAGSTSTILTGNLNATYDAYGFCSETDVGGGGWTNNDIDALEGYLANPVGKIVRVGSMMLMVDQQIAIVEPEPDPPPADNPPIAGPDDDVPGAIVVPAPPSASGGFVIGDYSQCTEGAWPWETHCGQADPCLQAYMFPSGYCDQNQKIIEPEGPASIILNAAYLGLDANNFAPEEGPWGPILGGVSDQLAQPFRHNTFPGLFVTNRKGIGSFFLDEDSPWGRRLKLAVGIGCDKVGVVRDGMLSVCDDIDFTTQGWCQFSDAEAFLDEDSPWGRMVAFRGSAGCSSWGVQPASDFTPERDEPYHVQFFGLDCYFCKFLLWTIETPCFGCKWDWGMTPSSANCGPNDEDCFTGSTDGGCAQPNHVGDEDVECIARFPIAPGNEGFYRDDWRYGCAPAIGDSCSPDPVHNCQDCEEKRFLGATAQLVLETTDALRRLVLAPITVDPLEFGLPYSCGVFGWQSTGMSLANPGITTADTLITEPCGCGFVECPTQPGNFCAVQSLMVWDLNRPKTVFARLVFYEGEICNPGNGPCDSAPCQSEPGGCDAQAYSNPSSEIVLNCEALVQVVFHYQYFHGYDLQFAPERCCVVNESTFGTPKKATLTGRYKGPVLFGKRENPGWFGYRADDLGSDYIDFGVQSGGCASDPNGQPPLGACMNPFVNHGRIDDWFVGPFGGPEFTTPPKQCPSFVIDDTGQDRFFCPPKLIWTWELQESDAPEGGEVGAIRPETAQCWDVEALRNKDTCIDGTFSPDPTSATDSGRYECTPVECRKGCDILVPQRDLDLFCNRYQPCEEVFGPRPWSCGQCKD